jgi:parallel beta-helix repeat protein
LYSTVTNNSFESNGIVMMYSAIVDYTMIHTIENNTVNGKPIRYYKNKKGITVPEDTGQVIATNCNNLTIKNLTISDASIGIELLNCSHCDIYNNTIENNSLHGISLVNTYDLPDNPLSLRTHSNSNIISRNNIRNNWDGIMIFNSCRNNSISENNFKNNTCAINITWSIDYHNYHFPAEWQVKTKPRSLKNFFDRTFFLLFKRNDFNKNNFFENIEHVTFEYNSFFFARWRGNYWDEPLDSPYPIYGTLGGYNWINIDWRPAIEPYEI